MRLEDVVHEWLRKGQQDANSARFLLDMVPPPLEIIGFHAQQAVEKSLKGMIVRAGVDPPRTHDLVYLHHQCAEQAGIDLQAIELCARLTPYAVDQRYPTDNDPDHDQVLRDVTAMEDFVNSISKRLEATESDESQL